MRSIELKKRVRRRVFYMKKDTEVEGTGYVEGSLCWDQQNLSFQKDVIFDCGEFGIFILVRNGDFILWICGSYVKFSSSG